MKNLSKFCTIEQLEQLKRNNPNNGIVDIKLANLYASLNETSKAIDYYKKALVNTQRSNFSLYSYALFLAQNDFVNIATTLAEEITLDNVKSIEYKTKIYELIGDELLKEGEVDGANKAYQISFKYAKNTKNKELSEKICKKYAEEFYIELTDEIVVEKLQKSNTLLAEFFGRKNIKAPLTIVGIKQIKI